MQFIAISKRLADFSIDVASELALMEARAAWELHKAGDVVSIHFDEPQSKGIMFIDCATREDAALILAGLPMVAEGLIDFDIYHLGPFSRLEMLFGKAR
jgi:hypothetical protein